MRWNLVSANLSSCLFTKINFVYTLLVRRGKGKVMWYMLLGSNSLFVYLFSCVLPCIRCIYLHYYKRPSVLWSRFETHQPTNTLLPTQLLQDRCLLLSHMVSLDGWFCPYCKVSPFGIWNNNTPDIDHSINWWVLQTRHELIVPIFLMMSRLEASLLATSI